MKSRIVSSLIIALALATPAFASDLSAAERSALAARPSVELASLRAGESTPVPGVANAERSELERAAVAAGDLDALRAGDISDRELVIIAVVIAIVALVIVL